jgi:hypothetical protein
MAENNPYAEYASTQLYQDASGKGAMIGTAPVADQGTAAGNMGSISGPGGGTKKKKGKKEQVQEEDVDYLASLFDGEELSENFKFKAKTIFEAAINERVSVIEAHILEAAKELIEEQAEAAKEVIAESTANTANNLVEHIDGYLNYVVEEWMTENKVAVERGLRTEIAENFINGLKDLFESSFIDVPQEKYNVLDDIYEANEELQTNLNKMIKENIELKNEVTAHLCAEAFMRQASGLADTEIEKLAKLAEGVEFENVQQYERKVALLKESYFNRARTDMSRPSQNYQSYGQVPLTEDTGSYVGSSNTDPLMENIVNTLSLMNKNKPKVERAIPENSAASKVASLINPGLVKDNVI